MEAKTDKISSKLTEAGGLAALASVPILAGGFAGFAKAYGLDVHDAVIAAAICAPSAVSGVGGVFIGSGIGYVSGLGTSLIASTFLDGAVDSADLEKDSQKGAITGAVCGGIMGAAVSGVLTALGFGAGYALGYLTK